MLCSPRLPWQLGTEAVLAQLPQAEQRGWWWLGGSCSGQSPRVATGKPLRQRGRMRRNTPQSARTCWHCSGQGAALQVGRGCLPLSWGRGVPPPHRPDPRVQPLAGPGLGRGLTPELRSGTDATPSSFQPRGVGGVQDGRERRRPGRASFPFKSLMAAAQTRRPGTENVGKDSLPNFPGLCSGGGRGGRASLGGGPRARPCASWRPRPRPRRRWRRRPPSIPPAGAPSRPGPRPPSRVRPGPAGCGGRRGRGRGNGRRLPGHPRVPPRSRRCQVHVRPADCPRSGRSRAERGRGRPPAPGHRRRRPRGAAVTSVPRPQLSAQSRSWKFPGFAGAGLGFSSDV